MLSCTGKGSYRACIYLTVLVLLLHLFEYLYLTQLSSQSNFTDSSVSESESDDASIGEKFIEERELRESEPAQATRGPVFSKFEQPLKTCRFGVCYSDLLQVKPPEYDPRFKNPCWYQHKVPSRHQTLDGNKITFVTQLRNFGDGGPEFLQNINSIWERRKEKGGPQFRCLPYFILIGTAKSGSSDLYARLQLHPQIALSRLKEPQWYTFKRFVSQEKTVPRFSYRRLEETPVEDYISIFDGMSDQIENSPHLITGDGSSNLFSWNYDWNFFEGIPRDAANYSNDLPKYTVADQIKTTNPGAKLLLILRDPTERLFSAYQYFPHLHSNKSREDFHEDVVHDIDVFNECRKQHNSRFCVYHFPLKRQLRLDHLIYGLYSVFLQDWYKVFSSSEIKVINQNVYREKIGETMDEIISFLELSPFDPVLRSMVVNQLPAKVTHGKIPNMLPETQELLNKFYEPYNKQLAQLTGDVTFNKFQANIPTNVQVDSQSQLGVQTAGETQLKIESKTQSNSVPENRSEEQLESQPELQSEHQLEKRPEFPSIV